MSCFPSRVNIGIESSKKQSAAKFSSKAQTSQQPRICIYHRKTVLSNQPIPASLSTDIWVYIEMVIAITAVYYRRDLDTEFDQVHISIFTHEPILISLAVVQVLHLL